MARLLRILTLCVIMTACLEQSLFSRATCVERCDCVRLPQSSEQRRAEVQEDFQKADVVFVGTFQGYLETAATVGSRLRVDEVWKGTPGSEAVLGVTLQNEFGTSWGNSCWYYVAEGQHVIFGRKDPSGMLLAHACGSTGPVKERAEVIQVLRELRAQSAEVSGRITDIAGGVLPGVLVVITAPRLRREAVTDVQGRFVFSGLAMGTYRVETTLTGFLSQSGSVTLSSSTPRAHLTWPLQIGCLIETVRVRLGPRAAAPLVESILHVRIQADRGHVSWSWRPECANVVQSYSAVVLNEQPQRTADILLPTSDARLQTGREYIVFMWPGSLTGDDLVYAIDSGRVVSTAPAPLGGMPVAEALALVKSWAKRPPR